MTDSEKVDYKDTVYLPTTDFPMRAGLPKVEPKWQEKWAKLDLYAKQRERAAGLEKFVLHDGPPYANGNIHIGHALNKILKDVISRSQYMLGKDAAYVPGWDCHGLPIEWKIEEKYRKKKKNKDDVPVLEFRQECRDFAAEWIDVQRDEFKRLGIIGDWDNPYQTMNYTSEARIVKEIGRFLMNGGLYKGLKPVMWSPVEKTALAEAEVEYQDHTSTTIFVGFEKVDGPAEFDGARFVIWTTTPWTIPGNRAIAYGPEIAYEGIEVSAVSEDSIVPVGSKLIVATDLMASFKETAGITDSTPFWSGTGDAFEGVVCQHPFAGQGYDFPVPLLGGAHVTTEQGTGLVHTAPSHGVEDFEVAHLEHGIEVPETVLGDGSYAPWVPLFAGIHVYKAAGPVCEALAASGALMQQGTLVHSYPHSWRSKKPLIYRATAQWFISMETNDLRQNALTAINNTAFYPEVGRNRLYSMVENRPDWCVSRQRAWGVPITVFVNKMTGEPLRDQAVVDRIVASVEAEGVDAWYSHDTAEFLGDQYNADEYEKVTDILDVWFDSGSTHAFVLEERPDLKWPADLYLEGSDQHRGWFHSSLLESCGTRGRAPYDGILTHGFTLDGEGRKMSKSLGNVIAPQKIIDQYGADILRLWVVSTEYREDQRISMDIIKAQADVYRKIRNTLRFLLGGLEGFSEEERLDTADMPELERWVLHRLSEMDKTVRDGMNGYDFHDVYVALHTFCTTDLSNFYLDIRKDALYCDAPDSIRRRACRTILDITFDALVRWLAPILCFTAEEAWASYYGDKEDDSIHLHTFRDIPADWHDPALAAKWAKIRRVRRGVTGALEVARKDKVIGASLQAAPTVTVSQELADALAGQNLAEISITSAAKLSVGAPASEAFVADDIPDVGVTVHLAEGRKCARCWQVLPEVGSNPDAPETCNRCAAVVTSR